MSDVVSCPSCGKYFDATFDVESCARCGVALSPEELQAARNKKVEAISSPSGVINWIFVIACVGFYLYTIGNPFSGTTRGTVAGTIGSFIGKLFAIGIIFGPATLIAYRCSKSEKYQNFWGAIFLAVFFGEIIALTIFLLIILGLFGALSKM